MDQIYIPKNRTGFNIGNYVVIKLLEAGIVEKSVEKLYFYRVKELEPLKLEIIREVMKTVSTFLDNYSNILVTGSFLDEGFHFNDIDVLIITESKINPKLIKRGIERKTAIKGHVLIITNKEIANGLKTDPLYQMMLSRCVSKKRFIYKIEQNFDYKLLDLHLLKSKTLIDNFEVLRGNEKHDLVRNLMSIYLFLKKKKITVDSVNKEIKRSLGADVKEIKDNLLDKHGFLKNYKLIYNETFKIIIDGIKYGSKSE